MIKGLSDFEKNYRLDAKVDWAGLEKSRKAIADELAKSVDQHDPTSKMVLIPRKEALSVVQAGNLDNKIQQLDSELLGPINALAATMKAKRNFWSIVFRTLFAVGSLILISVKVGEWRKNKQEVRSNQLRKKANKSKY